MFLSNFVKVAQSSKLSLTSNQKGLSHQIKLDAQRVFVTQLLALSTFNIQLKTL